MAEELKELIEKIHEEGIKAAEEKAREITLEAERRAKAMVEKASKESARLIEDTEEKIKRMEDSTKVSLNQAARDMLLSLRKEIDAMLDSLVVSHLHKAFTAEEIKGLLVSLVKNAITKDKEGIVILLKKDDLEKVEKGLLNELRGELKKGLTLKSDDDIRAGFRISYDAGKSYYDFTDKALADYIGLHIKPKLAGILNETALGDEKR